MTDYTQKMVSEVLAVLSENGQNSVDKILIHKFLYFLDTQGLRPGLTFEPYTYGPFSFELSRVLDKMMFWEEIADKGPGIQVIKTPDSEVSPPEWREQIRKQLTAFKEIVGSFSFDNLECAGTVLYCAQALALAGRPVDRETVIREFKAWKGARYTDEKIAEFWNKIEPYLPPPPSSLCQA